MATTINASASSGLITTADTSTILQLQTGGTTALAVSAAQVVTLTNPLPVASGGSGGTTSTGTGANVLGTTPSFTSTIGVGGATASASGAGITFPSTDLHYSTNANTLDDYEEGTFTPTVGDAPSGGNAATLASAYGFYTKIGRVVQFSIRITLSSKASMSAGNALWIRGLPFAVGSGFVRSVCPAYTDFVTFTGTLIAEPSSSLTSMDMVSIRSNNTAAVVTVADITNAFFLITQGTYQVD